MKRTDTIGFIGAGNMGEAMIRGLAASGHPGRQILAHDPDRARLAAVSGKYKVRKADLAGVLSARVAVVAVKPQSLSGLLPELAGRKLPLLVSIMAGVRVERFNAALGPRARVVRAMPNAPGLIGQGVSAYYRGPGVTAAESALARAVLTALGPAYEVKDESLLDAVTGLSGSGPAYVFVLIEALADAGVKMGLARALALALAAQTVAGSGRMVIETGEHPAALKDKVASPGGTTICGLAELERGGFRSAVMAAVEAATLRSRQLAAPTAAAEKGPGKKTPRTPGKGRRT